MQFICSVCFMLVLFARSLLLMQILFWHTEFNASHTKSALFLIFTFFTSEQTPREGEELTEQLKENHPKKLLVCVQLSLREKLKDIVFTNNCHCTEIKSESILKSSFFSIWTERKIQFLCLNNCCGFFQFYIYCYLQLCIVCHTTTHTFPSKVFHSSTNTKKNAPIYVHWQLASVFLLRKYSVWVSREKNYFHSSPTSFDNLGMNWMGLFGVEAFLQWFHRTFQQVWLAIVLFMAPFSRISLCCSGCCSIMIGIRHQHRFHLFSNLLLIQIRAENDEWRHETYSMTHLDTFDWISS